VGASCIAKVCVVSPSLTYDVREYLRSQAKLKIRNVVLVVEETGGWILFGGIYFHCSSADLWRRPDHCGHGARTTPRLRGPDDDDSEHYTSIRDVKYSSCMHFSQSVDPRRPRYPLLVPVSVEARLIFVEPGRRWAHSTSPSKAPSISYEGTMKTSVRMLKTSGGLYNWAPGGFFFL